MEKIRHAKLFGRFWAMMYAILAAWAFNQAIQLFRLEYMERGIYYSLVGVGALIMLYKSRKRWRSAE